MQINYWISAISNILDSLKKGRQLIDWKDYIVQAEVESWSDVRMVPLPHNNVK